MPIFSIHLYKRKPLIANRRQHYPAIDVIGIVSKANIRVAKYTLSDIICIPASHVALPFTFANFSCLFNFQFLFLCAPLMFLAPFIGGWLICLLDNVSLRFTIQYSVRILYAVYIVLKSDSWFDVS